MSFMAIKAAILAVTLALGCAGGPDELELGYGHLFAGDSSLEGWEMANDDSDLFTVGLVWKLRPTRVVVENPVAPPVRWSLETAGETISETGEILTDLTGNPLTQDAEEAELPTPGEISDTLEAFDAFGTVTKIGFFLLAGLVLWTYRERLGRLIPGGNGSKKKS